MSGAIAPASNGGVARTARRFLSKYPPIAWSETIVAKPTTTPLAGWLQSSAVPRPSVSAYVAGTPTSAANTVVLSRAGRTPRLTKVRVAATATEANAGWAETRWVIAIPRNASSVLKTKPSARAPSQIIGATRNRSIESGRLRATAAKAPARATDVMVMVATRMPPVASGGIGALSTKPANRMSGRVMPPMSSRALATVDACWRRSSQAHPKNTDAMNASTSG